jgi:hypothetical protein
MFALQLAGDPFDRTILVVLETDDGTFQSIYISNDVVDWDGDRPIYSDESATSVWEYPAPTTLRQRFADGVHYSDRTHVLIDGE